MQTVPPLLRFAFWPRLDVPVRPSHAPRSSAGRSCADCQA